MSSYSSYSDDEGAGPPPPGASGGGTGGPPPSLPPRTPPMYASPPRSGTPPAGARSPRATATSGSTMHSPLDNGELRSTSDGSEPSAQERLLQEPRVELATSHAVSAVSNRLLFMDVTLMRRLRHARVPGAAAVDEALRAASGEPSPHQQGPLSPPAPTADPETASLQQQNRRRCLPRPAIDPMRLLPPSSVPWRALVSAIVSGEAAVLLLSTAHVVNIAGTPKGGRHRLQLLPDNYPQENIAEEGAQPAAATESPNPTPPTIETVAPPDAGSPDLAQFPVLANRQNTTDSLQNADSQRDPNCLGAPEDLLGGDGSRTTAPSLPGLDDAAPCFADQRAIVAVAVAAAAAADALGDSLTNSMNGGGSSKQNLSETAVASAVRASLERTVGEEAHLASHILSFEDTIATLESTVDANAAPHTVEASTSSQVDESVVPASEFEEPVQPPHEHGDPSGEGAAASPNNDTGKGEHGDDSAAKKSSCGNPDIEGNQTIGGDDDARFQHPALDPTSVYNKNTHAAADVPVQSVVGIGAYRGAIGEPMRRHLWSTVGRLLDVVAGMALPEVRFEALAQGDVEAATDVLLQLHMITRPTNV